MKVMSTVIHDGLVPYKRKRIEVLHDRDTIRYTTITGCKKGINNVETTFLDIPEKTVHLSIGGKGATIAVGETFVIEVKSKKKVYLKFEIEL